MFKNRLPIWLLLCGIIFNCKPAEENQVDQIIEKLLLNNGFSAQTINQPYHKAVETFFTDLLDGKLLPLRALSTRQNNITPVLAAFEYLTLNLPKLAELTSTTQGSLNNLYWLAWCCVRPEKFRYNAKNEPGKGISPAQALIYLLDHPLIKTYSDTRADNQNAGGTRSFMQSRNLGSGSVNASALKVMWQETTDQLSYNEFWDLENLLIDYEQWLKRKEQNPHGYESWETEPTVPFATYAKFANTIIFRSLSFKQKLALLLTTNDFGTIDEFPATIETANNLIAAFNKPSTVTSQWIKDNISFTTELGQTRQGATEDLSNDAQRVRTKFSEQEARKIFAQIIKIGEQQFVAGMDLDAAIAKTTQQNKPIQELNVEAGLYQTLLKVEQTNANKLIQLMNNFPDRLVVKLVGHHIERIAARAAGIIGLSVATDKPKALNSFNQNHFLAPDYTSLTRELLKWNQKQAAAATAGLNSRRSQASNHSRNCCQA